MRDIKIGDRIAYRDDWYGVNVNNGIIIYDGIQRGGFKYRLLDLDDMTVKEGF